MTLLLKLPGQKDLLNFVCKASIVIGQIRQRPGPFYLRDPGLKPELMEI